MKKIKFKNKKEWLAYRNNGIGGSEASSILGTNQYKTNTQLWEEKMGLRVSEDISDKPRVKYGTNAEAPIRELTKLDYPEYKITHQENTVILNEEYEFLFASLDGEITEIATKRKGILEIKTTEVSRSSELEKWKGRIPDNYYAQILHYLIVTNYEFVLLAVQIKFGWDKNKKEIKYYLIEKQDVLEDIKYLKEEEIKFWNNNILKKIKPNVLLPQI